VIVATQYQRRRLCPIATIFIVPIFITTAACLAVGKADEPTLPPELTSSDTLSALGAVRLVRELSRREALVREAAIRRLSANPEAAAAPLIAAFGEGSLAMRLAAIEILSAWQAPIEGLDPWRPETITQQRLEALSKWAENPATAAGASAEELSGQLVQSASEQIRQMLAASDAEAAAIRERLARHGRLILPLVYAQLQTAQEDAAPERLTALRYRLVATGELALSWPGGLIRLASVNPSVRRQAMDELAARATTADEPLLLELFSDPDPLMRELALTALTRVGGSRANSALVRLLADPDPNVEAAVLKRLAESPALSALPQLKDYVARQQDPDLLVHAVRVLRAIKTKSSVECLAGLLTHESWRVRAEAAEAIGEVAGDYGSGLSDEDKADAYVALVDLLNDEDAFVVSRAVKVLAKAHLAVAVNPLADVAARHPELAVEVIDGLAGSSSAQAKVAEHLRRFANSQDSKIRAAAIKGLCQANAEGLEEALRAGLADPVATVRIAAAQGLFQQMESNFLRQKNDAGTATPGEFFPWKGSLAEAGASSLLKLFSGGSASEAKKPEGESAVKLPAWMKTLDEPLLKMLGDDAAAATADAASERLAAALPLIALGKSDSALPAVKAAVKADPSQLARAALVLKWLPAFPRQEMYELLLDQARSADDIATVAQQLAQEPRQTEALWQLMERPDASAALASRLIFVFRQQYLGDSWYNLENIPQKELAEISRDLSAHIARGTQWQRLTALSLLVTIDAAAAAEEAQRLANDTALDESLRDHAFRMLLFAAEKPAATRLAIDALSAASPARRKAAIVLLAEGRQALDDLDEESLGLFNSATIFSSGSSRTPIPDPPQALTAELLHSLLEAGDERERSDAGYLLCLLGEPGGLAPLLRRWKQHGRQDEALTKRVVQAIAALDDGSQTPLLTEIYQQLAGAERLNESDIAELYWTIRSMTGADVLALRKRIRDEIGIDTLQRNNPFGDSSRQFGL
jgi:HEAT repeat protein